jgi:hypothetical protein
MPSIFGAPRGWRRPLILTAAGEANAAFPDGDFGSTDVIEMAARVLDL